MNDFGAATSPLREPAEHRSCYLTWRDTASDLGKHQHVKARQRVIATATVYLARFFYNNSYKDFHPHLIAATALYLASKVEESPVQVRLPPSPSPFAPRHLGH
jgi:hypothetical protein